MYEIQINVKRRKFIASVGGSMKQVFNEVYSILNVAEIRKNNKNDFYSIHFDFKNIIHIELGISLFIYHELSYVWSILDIPNHGITKKITLKYLALNCTLHYYSKRRGNDNVSFYLEQSEFDVVVHQIRLCKNKMQHH